MANTIINVRDYGAVGNGSHDDTQNINDALAAVPANGGTIYFPDSVYVVTGSLNISRHGTRIVGAGDYATVFSFNPSSPGLPLFDFTKTGEVLYHCGIKNVKFQGLGSYQKIGILATDTSELSISDLSMAAWTGNSSIGIQLRGRELTTIRRTTVFADRPISIENNPNSTIDCDHLHMQDMYLVPLVSTESCVHIEPNINVTNLTIDGTSAFCLGKHGIYWDDTEAPIGTSLHMSLRNIRREQTQDAEGYTIFINHYVQNILCENIGADNQAKGFYFRNCRHVTLQNCFYDGTTQTTEAPEGLNLDESCQSISLQNCFWQKTSTRSIGNLESVSSTRKNTSQQFPANEFLDVAV